MTASEVVKFYHNILKETAENHELIQVSEDYETIAWAYEEDGKIIIEAWGEGTGTIEVYTYSGDILATCVVTVEYTIWDRIRSIFDNMFLWFNLFF